MEATGPRVVTGKLAALTPRTPRRSEPRTRKQGPGEPSRPALMLALAYRIERAIEEGEVRDQAEAARRLGVTRARLSQVQDLALFAPGIQEAFLALQSA